MNLPNQYELFYMIRNYNKNDTKEVISDVVDLLDRIRNDPKDFTYKLEELLEEYAEESGKCSMCGEQLTVQNIYEPREYQGSLCGEEIYKKYCPNHGFTD